MWVGKALYIAERNYRLTTHRADKYMSGFAVMGKRRALIKDMFSKNKIKYDGVHFNLNHICVS